MIIPITKISKTVDVPVRRMECIRILLSSGYVIYVDKPVGTPMPFKVIG